MCPTIDVRSEVARRVRLGEDPALLAAEFDVTLQTVRRWLAAAGLSELRKPAADPAAVVAAYASGEPLRVIAKRFGVDDKTVLKIVRRSGQPMRRPRLTREVREEILARRRSGEKAAEIAAELGVSYSTVWRVIGGGGVP